MASSCTFAGVPFLLPTEELEKVLADRLPLDDVRISTPERSWPGSASVGLAYPLRWPERPKLRLNDFFYPTHASRWAEFNGVVDQSGYETILATCFSDGGTTNPAPADFTMSQDDLASGFNTPITTQLFCLPPRPVFLADQSTGLYLVTLVDQRYYFQWST